MPFKNPEILYALFLLVIPILVHLFQLRRFKKTYFTNVKLLKELQQQTRKSSTLKKWLLLTVRLLLLTFLIFAFAQPFFTAQDSQNKDNELVILLDNSFSMQAKGSKGELFKRAVQDVLENIPENQPFSLLTPSHSFWDTDSKAIRSDLQKLTYTSTAFNPDYLLARVKARKPRQNTDFIIITDGLNVETEKLQALDEKSVFVILPTAENKTNAVIEKVEITQVLADFYELTVSLRLFGTAGENYPLTIFDDEKTIAKTQVKFDKETAEIQLNIPKKAFKGKAVLHSNDLEYDNTYYFTVAQPKKQNVLFIGTAEKNEFLTRIITPTDFNVTNTTLNQVNYNAIQEQQTIILNELNDIPQPLVTNLQIFYQNGGTIVLIPAQGSAVNINSALQKWTGLQFENSFNEDKQITKINFDHPLYKGVFEKRITNFQYPKTRFGYTIKGNPLNVLNFEDNSPFLASVSNKSGFFYVFSAPLNKEINTFQNSPLVVPTFYNIAKTNVLSGNIAYTISENNAVLLDAVLSKDEVISVSNSEYSFIPIQQILNHKVKLSFGDYPEKAGNYTALQKNDTLADLSFNYPRNESTVSVQPNSIFTTFTEIKSVADALDHFHLIRTDTAIWKWFLWIALAFLLIELLIQKILK